MKLIRISAIWCTSCILTYSIWQDIQKEYPHFEYIEYDYDTDSDLFGQYQIGSILPVILVFNKNQEVTRIIGEKTKAEIKEILNQL